VVNIGFYIYRIRLMMTYQTALVLEALAAGRHHGWDIMDATDLPSGTVYPILRRIEEEGLARARALGAGERGSARAAPGASLLRAYARRGHTAR
jgi:DNA-binding MarR family transcriptional regulator